MKIIIIMRIIIMSVISAIMVLMITYNDNDKNDLIIRII